MSKQTYDPEKFQLPFARLKKGGHVFELAIDQEKALAFRQGKDIPVLEILHYEKIFADVQKGQLSPEDIQQSIFHTTDLEKVAGAILAAGEVHYTAKFRDELRTQKYRAIVNRIHKYGVDPRTQAPHPVERIERALSEAKITADEHQTVEEQVKGIIRKLQPILPISFQEVLCEIHVDAHHAHQAYGKIKQLGKINKENWNEDGSLSVFMRVPAGLYQEVIDTINSLTKGTASVTTIEKEKVE